MSFFVIVWQVSGGKEVFTEYGLHNFSFPIGVKYATVSLWGAGGGGGAYNPSTVSNGMGSYGGGGGAFVKCRIKVTRRSFGLLIGQGGQIGEMFGSETQFAFGGGGNFIIHLHLISC